MNEKYIGSDFDDFLRDERLLDAAEAMAAKRVIAFQIAREMETRKLSKSGIGQLACTPAGPRSSGCSTRPIRR